MAIKPVNAGFRCVPEVYEKIKQIAALEQRSISNVINMLLTAALLQRENINEQS